MLAAYVSCLHKVKCWGHFCHCIRLRPWTPFNHRSQTNCTSWPQRAHVPSFPVASAELTKKSSTDTKATLRRWIKAQSSKRLMHGSWAMQTHFWGGVGAIIGSGLHNSLQQPILQPFCLFRIQRESLCVYDGWSRGLKGKVHFFQSQTQFPWKAKEAML